MNSMVSHVSNVDGLRLKHYHNLMMLYFKFKIHDRIIVYACTLIFLFENLRMFRMHDLQPFVSQNVIQIQCDEQIHCFGGLTLRSDSWREVV